MRRQGPIVRQSQESPRRRGRGPGRLEGVLASMLFYNRYFVLLWQGQLLSQLGNQAFLIATTFYVLEGTGSAAAVAATMMASTLPLVLLSPIGGSVADRHSRRSILVRTDLLRSASMASLAALVLWNPDMRASHLIVILPMAIFNGIMSALFAPAFQAFVPDLVSREELPAANAVTQISTQTSALVGQALGGFLYVAWGPGLLLLFDAVSFAYAGIATWLLPADRRANSSPPSIRHAFAQYMVDTRAGVTYVWRRPGMTAVLGIFAGVNCLFMPVFVLLPFYTREVLDAGPEWYGFLLSGSGFGALTGSLTAGIFLRRLLVRGWLVRGCLSGVTAGVLLLASTETPWIAFAAFIAIGMSSSIINVTVITAFQSSVPADVRGRVMALFVALSTAAVPIGIGFGGVFGELWRSSIPLVFAASGIAIGALAILSGTARDFDRLLDSRAIAQHTSHG